LEYIPAAEEILNIILAVGNGVITAGELDNAIESMLLGAVKVTGATAGFVALGENGQSHLRLIQTYGLPGDIGSNLLDFEAPAFLQAKSRESVTELNAPSRNVLECPPFSHPGMIEIVVPISQGDQFVGVLVLGVPENIWSGDETQRQALRLFAYLAWISYSKLDISDRERELQHTINQIASVATTMPLVTITLAHEVKNALNVLGVMIERLGPISSSLRADVIESRDRRKLADRLDGIREAGGSEILRLSELADMSRDLTSGRSFQESPRVESVYLNDVVALWVKLLQDTAREHSVKLNCRYDSTLDHPRSGIGHPCQVNPARLGQVIINLVSNALQASRPGSRVDLTTELRGDRNGSIMATLTVTDYGEGIPLSAKERIFEVFFSTKENAYGLGLPVVKAIVDACGGTINVNSEVGRGSIFVVGVPCR
jgi:signal transduction histidine kinase